MSCKSILTRIHPVKSRCKDEAHGAGGRVDLFCVCTFILNIYYFFTDIKVIMTEQPSLAELLAGHL